MPVQSVNTNIPTSEPSAPPPSTEGTATGGTASAQAATEAGATAPAKPEAPPAPSDSFGKSKGSGQKSASWDANDKKAGNSVADNVLNKVAAANVNNPQALAALSAAADDIMANFQQFCPPGGEVNVGAIISSIASHAVGPIMIPGADTLNAENQMILDAQGKDGGVPTESGAKASAGAPTESAAKAGASKPTESAAKAGASKPTESAAKAGATESGAAAGSAGVNIVGSSQTFPHLGALAEGDIMALCFIVMMEAAKSAQQDLKSIMDGVKLINKQKDGLRKVQDQINKLAAANAGGNDGDAAKGIGSGDQPAGGNTKLGGWQVDGSNPQTISFGAPGPDGEVAAGAFSYTTGADNGKLTVGDINALKDQIKNQLDSKSELGETESLRLQMAMDRVSKFMTALSNIEKKGSDTSSAIIQNMK